MNGKPLILYNTPIHQQSETILTNQDNCYGMDPQKKNKISQMHRLSIIDD